MMTRNLPERPNLEHLKKQAKDLLHDFEQRDPEALQRLSASAHPQLADALHAIAQEYGFPAWPRLKEHVQSLARSTDPVEALTAAVQSNAAARLSQLLERYPALKSRINEPMVKDGRGDPPLIGAVQRSNREMIDVLLRAGANINARGQWWAGGWGVLDDSAAELVPFLIERGAIVDAHAAARLGMFDQLQELVAADPSLVQARGANGQTPLHFASTIAIAQYLLDQAADLDARDLLHESTPAQYMLRTGQMRHYPHDRQDIARHLISHGCQTDILMAAALGDLALMRKHLDADLACIRTSVSEQYFPKRDPRSGGTIYIWMFGAHRTAHQIARDCGHDDVFRLLMERSPEDLKLAQACELGDEATFNALLAKRPNFVRTLSDDDRRKLVNAAQNNNTAAVRLMLDAGWPVDVRGEMNGTPLHWASWHGNAKMVRELLRHHAPVNVKGDHENLTPLGWALHGSENSWHRDTGDYVATGEALLQAGASLPHLPGPLEGEDSEPLRALLRRHSDKIGALEREP
jgi:ankyrin repeat protein